MSTRPCKRHLVCLSIASLLALTACGGSDRSSKGTTAFSEVEVDAGESDKKEAKLAGSQITVVARGALAANWGPVMQVRANGQLVGTLEVRSPTYQTYHFSTPALLSSGSQIDITFVNDAVVSGADRNLYVQSIQVDGKSYAVTAPEVRYIRGWDEIAGQEDMLWNGTLRLSYSGNQALTVRARGSSAGGEGPLMEVRLNEQRIAQVTVPNTEYDDYTFNLPDTLPAGSKLDIIFSNDVTIGSEDRNLYIDSIKVNGIAFKSTDPGVTYDRGVVDGIDVVAGRQDMLWNGGLRFSMSPPSSATLGFSWANENLWQENFDGPVAPMDWQFSAGAEFGPGARGRVSLVDVLQGGKALELAYSTTVCDGTGCPVYAAAVHKLKQPTRADTLRFRIKNTLEPEARVYALVKDGSGQTLQYRPERCPFETASDEWCNLDVDLRLPSAHWGGANNGLIQGNITELSLLVQALDGVRGRVPIEGTVQFDSVTLSNAPTTISFARGDAGAKWRELSLVDTSAKLGVAVHFSGSRRDKQDRLQKAKEAGFGFVRTDLYWDQIERVRRNYDFAAADQLVADARALGLKVLFILDYGNPLYKSGVLMSSEGERNAFAAYAAAAAARFKGQGVKFEIWNEQNSGANCPEAGFWPHRPHAQHYAQLVSATMRAIRPVDPGALVTLGGLTPSYTSPCELNEPTQFSFQYIRDLADAGGLNDVNALGYHPYYDIAERWGAELQMLRRLLREKGQPNLPVWETEWGVSSACPDGERPCTQGHTAIKRDRQAVRLARRLLVGLAMGLPINVWYDLADDGVDPNNREHHFGLYDHQLLAKPALAAMKTLAAVSQERLSGLVPDLPGGVHAVRFHKGAETIYAIWTERGNIQLTSDLNGLVNAVDVQGKNLAFSGRWTLRETDGPIYLTYR